MLEALSRFWRHICRSLEYRGQLLERLEQAELRLYALEQDRDRMLAVLRSKGFYSFADRRDDRPIS